MFQVFSGSAARKVGFYRPFFREFYGLGGVGLAVFRHIYRAD
jgi:hypothetical protein